MSNHATKLRQSGLRATAPRIAILGWLERHAKPVSVETLWKKVKNKKMDRVTIYRSLETLRKAGLVQRVDLGHSHAHYEAIDPDRHHHHLVCESCDAIEDFTVVEEQQIIRKLEQRHRFQVRSHSFEIFGLCVRCQ